MAHARVWRSVVSLAPLVVALPLAWVSANYTGRALVILVPPLVFAAYFGGRPLGLLATTAAAAGGFVLLASTRWPIHIDGVVRLTAVACIGIVASVAIGSLRASQARAQAHSAEREASERRYRMLFENSPVAKSLSRLSDLAVVAVNDAYCETFGVRREDLIGRTPEVAGMTTTSIGGEDVFARLAAGEHVKDLEVTLRTCRGEVRTVLMSSQLLDEPDGGALVQSTFVDITERRAAEAEARQAATLFRQLAESMREVCWLSDPDGSAVTYVSASYERVFGRTTAALYADAADWLAAVHADDREHAEALPRHAIAAPIDADVRIVLPDGRVRTLRIRITPVRDDAGAVVKLAGFAEDVTERASLEDQVRQTQKLESLGLLAGGVAHDFNNILAVISANTGLLEESLPQGHPDRELVDDIAGAVTRATSLTRQLLAFSRRQVIEPLVLDLNAAVSDTRKMLRRMVGEDVVISTSFEPDLGSVRIDPGYLVQVLMNLAVNARDAMPTGGELAISTRRRTGPHGPEIELAVSDTGCGMTDEVKVHAFEPFFTTKGVGKGTGLGLSVVHGIIEQAGGRIELESTLGVGTTFRIILPAINEPAEKIDNHAAVGAPGQETLLLVDDDLHVRVCAARALRSRGYTVIEAPSARDALRLLDEHPIDMLVTDVVMPDLDGRQLAEVATTRHPGLKVLYMSGYTDDAVVRHGVEHSRVAFLEKPFRNHALAGKVRQVLDDAA